MAHKDAFESEYPYEVRDTHSFVHPLCVTDRDAFGSEWSPFETVHEIALDATVFQIAHSALDRSHRFRSLSRQRAFLRALFLPCAKH